MTPPRWETIVKAAERIVRNSHQTINVALLLLIVILGWVMVRLIK
jgi:hypothetical protein